MAKTKYTTRKEGERREGVRRLTTRGRAIGAAAVPGAKVGIACGGVERFQTRTLQSPTEAPANTFCATSLPWRIAGTVQFSTIIASVIMALNACSLQHTD